MTPARSIATVMPDLSERVVRLIDRAIAFDPRAARVMTEAPAKVDEWFVSDGETVVGPVTRSLLVRGIKAGKVGADTSVLHTSWKEWRLVREVMMSHEGASPETATKPPSTRARRRITPARLALVTCALVGFTAWMASRDKPPEASIAAPASAAALTTAPGTSPAAPPPGATSSTASVAPVPSASAPPEGEQILPASATITVKKATRPEPYGEGKETKPPDDTTNRYRAGEAPKDGNPSRKDSGVVGPGF
jgi:hypothetical protein